MLVRSIISSGSIIWYESSFCLRLGRLNTNTVLQKIQRFKSISKLVDEWLMKEIMHSDTLMILHTDKCLKIRNLHTGIHFCTPEREEWNHQVKNINKFDETWFTDGSKTSKGTGATFITFN